MPGKIDPPPTPPDHVARAWLPLGVRPALVLVVAGAGHGKTMALCDLASEARAAGRPVAWLALDELDDTLAGVFAHLSAAVRREVPGFGVTLEALADAGELDARALWGQLLAELGAFGGRDGALVCLDDFHHVPLAWGKALLLALERAPQGVTVALTARRALGLPTARLVARGTAVQIGPEALALSDDDAARIWASHGGTLPAGLNEALEGWPLGVAFAARRGLDSLPALGAGGELAAFIAEECFAALPAAEQAFLCGAALLQAPSTQLATQVLARPDAAQLVERLAAEQLVRVAADGSFRLPAYMRDFLAREARRRLAPADQTALHAAAAAYHAARGEQELAFAHQIATGDGVGALATCRAAAPVLLARGRVGQLEAWLAALPATGADGPWRAFLEAQAAWAAGDAARSRTQAERALAGFRATHDRVGEAKAVIRLLAIATHHQDAAPPWDEARALAAAGGDEDRADLALAEALAAEHRGDLPAWQASNRAVLALPREGNIEVAQCAGIACLNLFTYELHRGELGQARHYVDEALALAELWNLPGEGLFTAFMRAHVDVLEGALDAAGAFLDALPTAWEELMAWHPRACAWTTVGAYHQARGDFQPAEQALARSVSLFAKAGFALGREVPLERQVWLALQRRQPRRALGLLDGQALDHTNPYDLALRLGRARALDLAGESAAAAEACAAIATDAHALGAALPEARARLYGAAALARQGDMATARTELSAGERLIEARGYRFLQQQDHDLWQDLARIAGTSVQPSSAPSLDIRLFAGLEVRLGGVLLDSWPRRKSRLVLAALTLHPAGLAAPDLAELIGEQGANPDSVQNNVAWLRRMLEPDLPPRAPSRYVPLLDGRYRLAPDLLESCDVVAFEQAIAAARKLQKMDPARAKEAYETAVTLYRGHLLTDPHFESIFEARREACRREASAALLWLVERHAFEANDEIAERHLARAAALGPAEEDVVLLQLRFFGLRRQADRVRHAYWDHRKALHQAVGQPPGEAVERAYRASLSGT